MSTIECVKYNILSYLIFQIMERSRSESHSKITEIFPGMYFSVYGEVSSHWILCVFFIMKSQDEPHCGNLGCCHLAAPTLVHLFSWSENRQFSFVQKSVYSLGTEVQLNFGFSKIFNELTVCQQNNSLIPTFIGSHSTLAKTPKLPSPFISESTAGPHSSLGLYSLRVL